MEDKNLDSWEEQGGADVDDGENPIYPSRSLVEFVAAATGLPESIVRRVLEAERRYYLEELLED